MKQVLPLIFAILCSIALNAQPIFVDADATGTNDGTTWQNAYTNLSEAIDAAQSGDNLWVAAGIYYPTHQPNYAVGSADARFNHFTLKNGVSIYGGFAGDETTIDQRDLTAYKTVISGDIDQNDNVDENGYVTSYTNVVGENSYKLFYFPQGSTIDTTAVLDGFVLAGARAENSNYPYNGGAAMLCFEASPKIKNCEFHGNYAMHYGGAIFLENSAMVLENCLFIGNKAGQHGGAFYFTNSEVRLKKCEFKGNEGLYGGAISAYRNESVSIFEDCNFENNKALDNAGVMTTGETPNVFKNCSFINNQAVWGGALVLYTNSNSEIVNCTFEGNSATGAQGGAIDAEFNSKVNIYNSSFKGNEAYSNGGAIYCKDGADLTAYNTLFTGNVNGSVMNDNASITNSGSAIYAYNSKVNLVNNTLVANYSFDEVNGAPINNWDAEMNIYNSVIWNNRGAVQVRFVGGATGEVNNSIIQGGYAGNGNMDKYPMFLGYLNPSATPSIVGNFNLLGNSPANNKGINTKLPKDKWDLDNDGNTEEVISCDLNGNPRVFAGVVDVGCYEQQLYTQSGYGIGLWSGTHMNIGTSGIALNGTDFTIEFWYFMQAGMDGSWHNILGCDPSIDNGFNRSPTMYVFQNDRIHYGYGNGTEWVSGDTEKAIKLNQWNHIAMSFNDATNTMKVYANGEFLEEMTGIGEVSSTPIKQINNDEELHGVIDEFRIWKEERTLEQLIANQNRTLSGNEANLALYYNFDQITNGEIEDLAGSNNGIISEDANGNLECGLWNSEAIATPLLQNVTNVGVDGFTISWLPVTNATEYYIDVATDKDFNNLVVASKPTNGATNYSVNGLSRGTVYYYKVTSNFGGYAYQYGHMATKLTPPGNALALDGSTYVEATNVCKYDLTGGATIETWLKMDFSSWETTNAIWASNVPNPISSGAVINNYVLVYEKTNSRFRIFYDGGIYDFDTVSVNEGEWNHIAVTIKNGTESHLYINGVEKGTFTPNDTPFPYGSSLCIGQEYDGNGAINSSDTSNVIKGEIDEFRVWDVIRSESEIQASMSQTLKGNETGLVTYYNFDQQSGTLLADAAKGFDGEIIGNVNWVESTIGLNDFVVEASAHTTDGFTLSWSALAAPYTIDIATESKFSNLVGDPISTNNTSYNITGLNEGQKYYFRVTSNDSETTQINYTNTLMNVPGNALWFDGKDDFVEANILADQGNKYTISMECWAYLDPTETHARFLAINTALGGNKYLLSYEQGKGFDLYDGISEISISSNIHIKGAWVHLMFMADKGGDAVFVLNGQEIGRHYNASRGFPIEEGDLISFGQEYDGAKTGDFLKGAIDEVRFWNKAFTNAEIIANMHKKLTGIESGLFAYYDFDQSEGQFVYEKVNGLDGTIISQPQWIQSEALVTPVWIVVDEVAYDSFDFGWWTVDGATEYKVQLATDANFTNIVDEVTLTGTHQHFGSLTENTEYFFRISSLTNRWSDWSAVNKVSTLLVPPGNALAFNGVDGEVNIGYTMDADWNSITLEAWVKLSPDQINGYPRIIGNFSGTGGFALNLWNQTNQPYFEFLNANGYTRDEVKYAHSVADNIWHHIAGTYDGTDMKLYLDGELVATFNNPGAIIKKQDIKTGIGNH